MLHLCYPSLSYSYWYIIVALLINTSMYIGVSVVFVLFRSCERLRNILRNNIEIQPL